MLLHYLVFGFISDVATGPVDVGTPASRIIELRNANQTVAVTLDPYDVKDFVCDLSPQLDENDTYEAITFEVTSEAAALGFEVLTGEKGPLELDGNRLQFWVAVDPAKQDSNKFNGQGSLCGIEFRTLSVKGRKAERTANFRVSQQ